MIRIQLFARVLQKNRQRHYIYINGVEDYIHQAGSPARAENMMSSVRHKEVYVFLFLHNSPINVFRYVYRIPHFCFEIIASRRPSLQQDVVEHIASKSAKADTIGCLRYRSCRKVTRLITTLMMRPKTTHTLFSRCLARAITTETRSHRMIDYKKKRQQQ
jgi:hypothetical protein